MTADFADYLDLLDASRALGIHPQSLRRLIKAGRLPGFFQYRSVYLIRRADLDELTKNYDPKPGRKPWAYVAAAPPVASQELRDVVSSVNGGADG